MKIYLVKYWWILVIFLILSVIGLRLLFNHETNEANGSTKKTNKYIVKKQDLKQTLTLSGKIDAEEKAILKFQTSGKLVWVGVKVGDKVNKFQAIASLDKREIEKNLKDKLLTYMKTRWDFEQLNDDNDINGKSVETLGGLTNSEKRILQKSQFGLEQSVLDVETTALALDYATITTPIAGLVTQIDAPVAGVNITPTSAEFDIVNPQSIFMSVLADQTEVVGLTEKMPVSISMDPYPDSILSGTVNLISFIPKSGESSTVYEVKITIPQNNSDYKYRIGMTADVIFTKNERKNILSVPTQYIKTDNSGKYITKELKGNKVKTYIEVGTEFDDDTEILSGLSVGDIIYD
jgi:membrane fusion protein, multidrug efflux system